MTRIKSYKDLDAWQRSMELAEWCYKLTEGFPRSEQFGLVSQVRRSAVSIPSNIAEGHERRSSAAFIYHLAVALGSQAELETQLELGYRLGLVKDSDAKTSRELVSQVGQLLYGLFRSLSARGGRLTGQGPGASGLGIHKS